MKLEMFDNEEELIKHLLVRGCLELIIAVEGLSEDEKEDTFADLFKKRKEELMKIFDNLLYYMSK